MKSFRLPVLAVVLMIQSVFLAAHAVGASSEDDNVYDPETTARAMFSGPIFPGAQTVPREIAKGISAGARSLYGTVGSAVGLIGDSIRDENLKNWGLNTYQEQQEANRQINAPAVVSYKDIQDFGDFARWASYGLMKSLTIIALLLSPLLAVRNIRAKVASIAGRLLAGTRRTLAALRIKMENETRRKAQFVTLAIGVITIAIITLRPPWKETSGNGSVSRSVDDYGAWITSPHSGDLHLTIDVSRYAVELVGSILVFGGIFLLFGFVDKERKSNTSE